MLRGYPVNEEDVPSVCPKKLRRVCTESKRLTVEVMNGKEIAVLFRERPENFLDICNPADPFPSSVWAQAAEYFKYEEAMQAVLPGNRYSCAQALAAKKLPFLEKYPLGEVCHFVHLAITQRLLLRQTEAGIEPMSGNASALASDQGEASNPRCPDQADRSEKKPNMPTEKPTQSKYASLSEVRTGVAKILNSAVYERNGAVHISNLKRIFRRWFGIEVSEAALGFARLVDLLADPYFRDVCQVQIWPDEAVTISKPSYGMAAGVPYCGFSGAAAHETLGGTQADRLTTTWSRTPGPLKPLAVGEVRQAQTPPSPWTPMPMELQKEQPSLFRQPIASVRPPPGLEELCPPAISFGTLGGNEVGEGGPQFPMRWQNRKPYRDQLVPPSSPMKVTLDFPAPALSNAHGYDRLPSEDVALLKMHSTAFGDVLMAGGDCEGKAMNCSLSSSTGAGSDVGMMCETSESTVGVIGAGDLPMFASQLALESTETSWLV